MKLTIVIITLMLSAVTAFGVQEKKDAELLGTLQGKVQKLTSRKKSNGPATVAGVKGAKNDRTDIYWKGKEKKVEINEDELEKFKLAMENLNNGEKAESLKKFEAFLQEFPKSPLHAEGTQAVQLLKAELNPQTPATAAAPPATPPPVIQVSVANPVPVPVPAPDDVSHKVTK